MDDSTLGDALFSPSKAAQQRAQAHDWQRVEVWLSSLYPNRALPTFERNADTLQALLALCAANEQANKETMMVLALEEEVLDEMSKADVGTHDEEADKRLLRSVESHLTSDGKQSLDALARLSTVLDSPSPKPEMMAYALLTDMAHAQALATHATALSHLHRQLADDLDKLESRLRTVSTEPAFAPPTPALSRQTANLVRQTKALAPKLQEYADRLAAVPPPQPAGFTRTHSLSRSRGSLLLGQLGAATTSPFDAPGATARYLASSSAGGPLSSAALEALGRKERDVSDVRTAVTRLEAQVRAYKDLPPSVDEARRLLDERESIFAELRGERDGRFKT